MKLKISLVLALLLSIAASNAQEFKKMKFNHVAFFVKDLKQSAQFYLDVLKLDTIPEPFHDGKHMWLNIGGGAIHIIQGADKPKEYFLNNHLCLTTDNVVGFTKMLEVKKIGWFDAKGNPNKITTRIDGVQQVWVTDPDGYWIEVNNAK